MMILVYKNKQNEREVELKRLELQQSRLSNSKSLSINGNNSNGDVATLTSTNITNINNVNLHKSSQISIMLIKIMILFVFIYNMLKSSKVMRQVIQQPGEHLAGGKNLQNKQNSNNCQSINTIIQFEFNWSKKSGIEGYDGKGDGLQQIDLIIILFYVFKNDIANVEFENENKVQFKFENENVVTGDFCIEIIVFDSEFDCCVSSPSISSQAILSRCIPQRPGALNFNEKSIRWSENDVLECINTDHIKIKSIH